MGRGLEIEKLLATERDFSEMIIVPNAPPVSRTAGGCEVAMNVVFSPADVGDVLMRLHRNAFGAAAAEPGDTGCFSFGVRDVGRFRVHHMTQRGSRALRIIRVPVEIPAATGLCDDDAAMERLIDTVTALTPGIIMVYGPSALANSSLVYALLNEVNAKRRGLLYVMERALSFLMMHHECIAIQAEVASDVASMDEGIANALLLDPDIAYIGEIRSTDDIPSLPDLLEAPILTILSSVSHTGRPLQNRITEILGDDDTQRIHAVVEVLPADDDKLHLNITPASPST